MTTVTMTTKQCPVCHEEQYADEAAFTYHVNGHFTQAQDQATAGPSSSRPSGPRPTVIPYQAGGFQMPFAPIGVVQDDAFCPLCNFPLTFATPVERNKHVNTCIDSQSRRDSNAAIPPTHNRPPDLTQRHSETDTNPDFLFDENTVRTNGQNAEDNWVEAGWDGPAKPGVWSDWVSRKVDKGDKWWDPVHGTKSGAEIPSNFTPGVMSVLDQILTRSVAKGITRSAVLARDAIHIKSSFPFDIGWGCGYRNALMAITALIQAKPAYRKPFSETENGSNPGVRRVQGWIEEAWKNGYDVHGKEHFRGKLLGTKKWIGTSDLYAMFTFKGIPCNLYDFVNDKTKSQKIAHITLVKWVKQYFDQDRPRVREGETVNNVLMGTGKGESVRSSRKLPLVLQHSGHSRLIVGYEETSRGDLNLLVFDPGRTMHKDIRAEGIASLSPSSKRAHRSSSSLSLSRNSTRKPSHESMNFSRPYTDGASEMTQSFDPPQLATTYTVARKTSFADGSQLRAKPHSNSASSVPRLDGGAHEEMLEEDEEVDEKGWVRKKVKKVIHPRSLYNGEKWKVPDALQPFRASASQLSNHKEYQILEFTGGPPLTVSEMEGRKKVSSHNVKG